MSTLKISIVTPSFNQGRYIENAIRSVLDQGYDNFEHIIYDNCSTDETLEVVAKYPHVKFYSEPDEGQSDALNKGFLKATGEVIGWLNADDLYCPGTFQKVNEIFGDQGIDAIYSNITFVDKDNQHIRNLRSHRPLRWLSLLYTFIQSTSFFFRSEIIKNNHLIDKNLHYSMDKDFFTRLLYAGYKFKYVDDYFAYFRRHETNKTKSSKELSKKDIYESIYIINKNTGLNLGFNGFTSFMYQLAMSIIAKPTRRFLVLSSSLQKKAP